MTNKKKEMDWRIICTGLVCLTAAEIIALLLGFNGTMLKIYIAIVAGAIGITIDNPFKK